ncbi:MAG: hypothetical protein CVU05_01980 [Bacteroidetes bacterium HGW-Bacteroidetes-21]|nr:MAG: hypothetical protein CVU05_01980 [Bacteroidetes bacterium HGW-Bacteroidetes-21]
MNTPTIPFEHIYVYLTGFKTIADGDIMALLSMDGYSKYAFSPVMAKAPKTDAELLENIDKCFNEILKQHKPQIHSKGITFITNLPADLEPHISSLLKPNHIIIFNEALTKKEIQPVVSELKKFLNK